MKKKYLLIIEFEGTEYHGWQVQKNGITVQEVVEKALTKITKTETTVLSSGRTDAGVHALNYPASFRLDTRFSPEKWRGALNSKLPEDVVVKYVQPVNPEFTHVH